MCVCVEETGCGLLVSSGSTNPLFLRKLSFDYFREKKNKKKTAEHVSGKRRCSPFWSTGIIEIVAFIWLFDYEQER